MAGLIGVQGKPRNIPKIKDIPVQRDAALDAEIAAEARRRRILSQGRGSTILSPLGGDSTVGATLIAGR